jgi:hypothetical protein
MIPIGATVASPTDHAHSGPLIKALGCLTWSLFQHWRACIFPCRTCYSVCQFIFSFRAWVFSTSNIPSPFRTCLSTSRCTQKALTKGLIVLLGSQWRSDHLMRICSTTSVPIEETRHCNTRSGAWMPSREQGRSTTDRSAGIAYLSWETW